MADNVAITAGAGTTIATDDAGAGGHCQIVKLAIATDGSATLIPADAGGLLVNLGTNNDVTVTNATAANCKVEATIAAAQTVAVTNAGTFATQVDGNALTALQLIDDTVFADDAAFTIGTSKLNVAGAAIVAHGAAPDAADAGDAGALLANRNRVLFTIGGHPNIQSSEYYTTGAATDDNILPAIAAGTIYVITQISVMCSAANTVNTSCRIGFGTASVPAQGATNADAVPKVIFSHPGIAPGSGVVKGSGAGIVGIGADGEELRITCSAPTTGSLIVQVDWYSIAS